jgi:hypothetical protein
MSKAREIADLLDIGGDIVLGALDNLPTGAAPDWNTLLNKPTLAPSATTDTTNADNITSGTMLVGRIGTGANNSTTYLRGDGTWTTNCTNFANCTTLTANCDNCSGTVTGGSGGAGVNCQCEGGNNAHTLGTNTAGTLVTLASTACHSACNCACNC